MRHLFIIIYLNLLSLIAFSQKITGFVYTKENKPLSYATIALVKLPDSSLVSGTITLANGKFVFDNVKSGNYFVKVTYVGYKITGKEVVIDNKDIIIDTIFVEEYTHQIDEAKVVGKMLRGKELVDRTVYNIPEEIAKTSNNGYDILKKIPQVQVDF